MQSRWVVLTVLASTLAMGEPATEAETRKVMKELRRGCLKGNADQCFWMGALAGDHYQTANGYEHMPDLAQAKWAYEHALKILEPGCESGDGAACNFIGRIYFGEVMHDLVKRREVLEKGCAAGHGGSCFDRARSESRSTSASVRWLADACQLHDRNGCTWLPRMVLAASVLDPVETPPMNGAALLKVLENSRAERNDGERVIALAIAQTWAGEKTDALAALAAISTDKRDQQVFIAYSELVAADGLDAARVEQAWQRLVKLVPMRDGKYESLNLQSDYARADTTELMQRAEVIATRNRKK